ncbi:MAG: hypothetical protein H7126_17015, partial [Candidatus Parcubacteria bacterium]|nr:hypothetical protein [Leptolyngbyaceae cyanobacterium LF-bin-113]
MFNIEAIVQLSSNSGKKGIVWASTRHDQMGGQRCLSRAHRPNVQIVNGS